MSNENETSVKAKIRCAIRLYGQTHYNKERIESIWEKRRWTNDTRIVKPVLEANGYFALNNGHNCNGSHTKFVNANGEVISVPKSINRMLWQREVRKHSIVGGMTVIGKLKS